MAVRWRLAAVKRSTLRAHGMGPGDAENYALRILTAAELSQWVRLAR
jgi:hypothetical protein